LPEFAECFKKHYKSKNPFITVVEMIADVVWQEKKPK
jgi:hypothetical protein